MNMSNQLVNAMNELKGGRGIVVTMKRVLTRKDVAIRKSGYEALQRLDMGIEKTSIISLQASNKYVRGEGVEERESHYEQTDIPFIFRLKSNPERLYFIMNTSFLGIKSKVEYSESVEGLSLRKKENPQLLTIGLSNVVSIKSGNISL